MNKQEYLNALRERLSNYSPAFIDEITEAFEEHFTEGESQGLSEAEVIDTLGSVDEVVENIRMMNNEQRESYNRRTEINIDLGSLSENLSGTIREAARAVNDGLSSFRESSQNAILKNMSLLDGSYAVIDVETRHSVDVRLVPGERLAYQFIPTRHLLLGNKAELYTGEDGDTALFKVLDGNGRLDISVPSEIQVVHVSGVGGDIYMQNLTLEEMNAETRSGDIKIYSADCRHIHLSAVSGDIKVENSGCADMNLSAVSGDIDVKRSTGSADCGTVSGDIDIRNLDGNSVSAHTVSGDIEAHSTARLVNARTTSGDVDLDLLSPFDTVEASSLSGDITCRPYHDDYQGTLQTSSGSIKVKAKVPLYQESRRTVHVGQGSGRLDLTSKSGDIELK